MNFGILTSKVMVSSITLCLISLGSPCSSISHATEQSTISTYPSKLSDVSIGEGGIIASPTFSNKVAHFTCGENMIKTVLNRENSDPKSGFPTRQSLTLFINEEKHRGFSAFIKPMNFEDKGGILRDVEAKCSDTHFKIIVTVSREDNDGPSPDFEYLEYQAPF